MDPKSVRRKLSAILSADVEGYSRLMEDDEIATVETITAYFATITSLINQWKGQIEHVVGDNILAEFSSVVDAVQCAVEIQSFLRSKNESLPESRRMRFRIGINLGDVIQEGGQIHGDGVNIAARIQGLADGGGICISGTAYDQIETKLDIRCRFAGEHLVKNIAKLIRVYKVYMEPWDSREKIGAGKKKRSKLKWSLAIGACVVAAAAGVFLGLYWKYLYLPDPENSDLENRMTFNLPQGPSLAVLPFENMTGDPSQEFLSDGITETIISFLSQTPKLFVIARNSTFAYKGKPTPVQDIGRELNAAYVIEGSVQKSGERIRITVQLINAGSGVHLWSERYDRELKDIFRLQDEISVGIFKALHIKLGGGEHFRSRFDGINNLKVVSKLFKALDHIHRLNIEGDNLARKEVLEVIAMDPTISTAYSILAATYIQDLLYGACKSNLLCFGKATEATRKALLLDESNSDAHMAAGWLFSMRKDFNNAVACLRRCIELNPNNADGYDMLGLVLAMSDETAEGTTFVKKAFLLNPIPPAFYYAHLGICYRDLGQYDEAIEAFKRSIQIEPDNMTGRVGLIAAYIYSGQDREAYKLGQEVLKLNPNFSVEKWCNAAPFKTKNRVIRFTKALRKAGLPE